MMSEPQQSSDDVDTLIREQAHRLFIQRVYLVVHFTLFAVVLIVTRGRMIRIEPLFAAWAVIILAHFVFIALFEQREAVIRQGLKKRKRQAQSQNDSQDDVFYDIGDDGELVTMSEEQAQESWRNNAS